MMKRFFLTSILPILILLNCTTIRSQTSDSNTPLTNTEVVKLVKAGFKDKSILTIIASRPAHFELSTDRMIDLKRNGVSEKIILAMIARQEGNDFDDEAWNEPFFENSAGNSNKSSFPQTGSPGDGSSTNIFGSSGGSKGTTKTRNGGTSGSGDTVTTGSATVRILRPPSEAGAPPKLEKTPSLTNSSIIELVEAGFSEGTIIRRIEQSPVDFELSKERINELRNHRVSEKIVAAMKTAMGGEATAPAGSSGNVSPRN